MFFKIFLYLFIGSNIGNFCQAHPEDKIVNGNVASRYQFPWQAAISVIKGIDPIRYCSGSLINQNFILTAAQFINNAELAQIQLGSINFSTPLLSMESSTFFIHPLYNAVNFVYDIGLIQLPQNILYSNDHRPIRLPSRSQSIQSFENAEAQISGFGVVSSTSPYLSEQLLYARMTIISNTVCAINYDPAIIQSNILCAIGSNFSPQAPCFGDTGSALVIVESNSWTQIGISLFYSNAGCEQGPVGFTRVTVALDWISGITGIPIRP